MLKVLLAVGAGSCFGGMARYLLSRCLQQWAGVSFPVGTMMVNVLGCLFIGVCYGVFERIGAGSSAFRLFLTVGFCGGFTTFSTFANESLLLFSDGRVLAFFCYSLLSFVLGLLAVWLGYYVSDGVWR